MAIVLYDPDGVLIPGATVASWTETGCDPTDEAAGCFDDDGTDLATDPASDLRWKKLTIPTTTDLGLWHLNIATNGTDLRTYIVFDTDFVRADSITDIDNVCTGELTGISLEEWNPTASQIPYSFWAQSQADSDFGFKMYSSGSSGATRGYKLYNALGTEKSHVDHSSDGIGAWYTDTIAMGSDTDEVWTVKADNSQRLRFGFTDGLPPMVSQGVGRFPEWAKTTMCRLVNSSCTHDIECSDSESGGTMTCHRGKCQYDACIPPTIGDWTPTQSCTFIDEIHILYGNWIIQNGITMELEGTTRFGFGGSAQKIRIQPGGKLVEQDTAKLGGCEAELSGEVLYLPFEEGTGAVVADWSGYENDATTSGGTWVSGGVSRGGALDGGVTIVPDDSSLDLGGDAFTISLWVNKKLASAGYADNAGINKWGSAGNSEWALMIGDSNSDKPQLFMESGSTLYATNNTTAALTLNTWQHLVGLYNGTHLKLYIDGEQKGIRDVTGVTMNTIPGRSLYIGGVSGDASMNALNTEFDEIRIFNRALSPTEINLIADQAPSRACVAP